LGLSLSVILFFVTSLSNNPAKPGWLTRLAIIAARLSAFAYVSLDDQARKTGLSALIGPDVSVISLSPDWHGPWPSIAREYCYWGTIAAFPALKAH
jgi:hypothetical protein